MLKVNTTTTAFRKSLSIASMILFLLFPQWLLASDIVKGQQVYKKHCIMCHGQTGQNSMAGAANFTRGDGLFKPDHQLLERINKGDKACPAYLGILKEQQIFDVIAYLRTLYR